MQARLAGDLASEPREQLKHNSNFCPLSSIHRGDNLCVASKANTVLFYTAQADTVAEFQETRSDQRDKTFTADGQSITSVTVRGDSAKPQEDEEERLHNYFEKDIKTQGIQGDIKPSKSVEGTMRHIFSPSRTSTDEQSTTVGSVVRRQKNISAKINVRLPVIKTRPGTCTPGGPGRHGVLTTKHPKPLPPYYAPALLKRLHDEYMALGACSKKRMVYFNRLVEP